MYLIVIPPDIAFVLHIVSQFMVAPHSIHYAIVLQISSFIKCTMFHGLHFLVISFLELKAYADANWDVIPLIDVVLLVIVFF